METLNKGGSGKIIQITLCNNILQRELLVDVNNVLTNIYEQLWPVRILIQFARARLAMSTNMRTN